MQPNLTKCDWDSQIQSVVSVLRDCLSDFFGKPTRVAVITQLFEDEDQLAGEDCLPEPIWLFDPDGWLEGHEGELLNYFKANPRWKEHSGAIALGADRDFVRPEIDDCFSFASLFSAGAFYGYAIAFFVDVETSMSLNPLEEWLRHATFVLGNEIVNNENVSTWFVPSIRDYASMAVAKSILSKQTAEEDTDRMHELVISLCKVSIAKEERKSPNGKMLFSNTDCVECIATFAGDSIPFPNSKRTGKLLGALPDDQHALLIDQSLNIIGIAIQPVSATLLADMKFGNVKVSFGDEEICEISKGKCYAPGGGVAKDSRDYCWPEGALQAGSMR